MRYIKILSYLLIPCLLVPLSSLSFGIQILVHPYIQPGNAPTLDYEEKVVLWQTEDVPGKFEFFLQKAGEASLKKQPIAFKQLDMEQKSRLYKVRLKNLNFDTTYRYKVLLNKKILRDEVFKTRTKSDHFMFAVFGCSGEGSVAQERVAKLVEKSVPEFTLHTGDFAYPYGTRMIHFLEKGLPYYTRGEHISKGSKLMCKFPLYITFGNHDLSDQLGLNIGKDGLPAPYYFDHPNNGPKVDTTRFVHGPPESVKNFYRYIGKNHIERMTNYSFDVGNIHMTVLDANQWAEPEKVFNWLKQDLKNTKATWKFVSIHPPLFSAMVDITGKINHRFSWLLPKNREDMATYLVGGQNQARKFVEILQQRKVDLVFTAHIHNYERTHPITYNPTGRMISYSSPEKKTLKKKVDCYRNPKGVIYVNSAAGGASLDYLMLPVFVKPIYSYLMRGYLDRYLAKYSLDRYSYTRIEIRGKELTLKQIDEYGKIIDQMALFKS